LAKYRAVPGQSVLPVRPTLRIDKWLWQARFFKTRGLATHIVAEGHCRVNGMKISKPSHLVGNGDTLTIPQGDHIRLIRILDLGLRRGPAPEAQALYLDLDLPAAAPSPLE
jgi:ribosome-associated heat shock protein Hsp15